MQVRTDLPPVSIHVAGLLLWGLIYDVAVKSALFFKGLLGFCVVAAFILKAICTPQVWTRYKTFSSLTPHFGEPWPESDLLIVKRASREIAKRLLLSIRQLPTIAGYFLIHLKKQSRHSIYRLLSHLVFQRQSKHGDWDSCPPSDAKKSLLPNAEKVSRGEQNRTSCVVSKTGIFLAAPSILEDGRA